MSTRVKKTTRALGYEFFGLENDQKSVNLGIISAMHDIIRQKFLKWPVPLRRTDGVREEVGYIDATKHIYLCYRCQLLSSSEGAQSEQAQDQPMICKDKKTSMSIPRTIVNSMSNAKKVLLICKMFFSVIIFFCNYFNYSFLVYWTHATSAFYTYAWMASCQFHKVYIMCLRKKILSPWHISLFSRIFFYWPRYIYCIVGQWLVTNFSGLL